MLGITVLAGLGAEIIILASLGSTGNTIGMALLATVLLLVFVAIGWQIFVDGPRDDEALAINEHAVGADTDDPDDARR